MRVYTFCNSNIYANTIRKINLKEGNTLRHVGMGDLSSFKGAEWLTFKKNNLRVILSYKA